MTLQTECDEMIPVIDAVRKRLQIRAGEMKCSTCPSPIHLRSRVAGEVDCSTRPKDDLYVTRAEINKYLDEKVNSRRRIARTAC